MINKNPIKNETAINNQKKLDVCDEQSKYVNIRFEINYKALRKCCPLKVIGDPDIIP